MTLASTGVVPVLAELIALRAMVSGRAAAQRGASEVSGLAQSSQRGRGMEYAESREYAPGDDARHIDWRLTARSGRPHTKLFQAERERLTLLIADRSPELYFGTRVRFKSVQAARIGALTAWMAIRDGDRVGALSAVATDAPVIPASGTRGALRVLDALTRWYAQPPTGETDLAAALVRARRLLRPGARVVVLADPYRIATVPAVTWLALAQHHELVVALLIDPIEQHPPIARLPFRLSTGQRIELALEGARTRQRWRGAFDAQVQAAVEQLQRRGARVQVVSTVDAGDAWLRKMQPIRVQRWA